MAGGIELSGVGVELIDEPGSGTVTSVSVTTANGVSGSVATSTSTPAISLTLGAITPSSVATGALTATGVVSMTNASVSMTSLPTSDPHVAGRLYTTAGAVFVSAG